MRNSIVIFSFLAVLTYNSCAQDPENQAESPVETNFEAVLFVDELQIPWGMAFLPDGSLLITEKSGQLLRFQNGQKSEISELPSIYSQGQGGLLDIALHPNYSENGWIYLSYASDSGSESGGNTAIARARLEGNTLIDLQVLYKGSPNTTAGQHFGSRLAFDTEGFLYFTIGDRGNRDLNPQDITRDGGKVYRIHDDGRIPADNPFIGQSGAVTAAYTYGNRNPQGMILHPETGQIWIHEHGPRGGDEINVVGKGNNYGWPLVTYGINYIGTPITDKTEMEGTVQPIHYWVPSIAPSGMTFVTSERYPSWQGSLLVGSLAFQYLERLELSGTIITKREKLLEDIGRVRNVIQGPDGYIYVAVERKGIYRLEPN